MESVTRILLIVGGAASVLIGLAWRWLLDNVTAAATVAIALATITTVLVA
jgi:hypothetical protein